VAETKAAQATFGWEELPGPAPERGESQQSTPMAPASRQEGRSRRARIPPELPPEDQLWDVRAAARYLQRSVSWVYHRAEDGTLPVRRLGGWGLRFIPGELRAWVEGGGVASRRSGE
jgi:predicted DNA-binding transcriptional regulator AlpA